MNFRNCTFSGITYFSTGAQKSSDSHELVCDSQKLEEEHASGLRRSTRKAALDAKQKMTITEELSGKLKDL